MDPLSRHTEWREPAPGRWARFGPLQSLALSMGLHASAMGGTLYLAFEASHAVSEPVPDLVLTVASGGNGSHPQTSTSRIDGGDIDLLTDQPLVFVPFEPVEESSGIDFDPTPELTVLPAPSECSAPDAAEPRNGWSPGLSSVAIAGAGALPSRGGQRGGSTEGAAGKGVAAGPTQAAGSNQGGGSSAAAGPARGGAGAGVAASGPSHGVRLLAAPPPAYPIIALRLQEQGSVLLEIDVDAAGRVVAARVIESSGFERLNQAAREGVLGWRFEPAMERGRAVPARYRHRIEFKVSNSHAPA